MYGLVNRCIELLVVRKFGDPIWEQIKNVAAVEINGSFSIYERYDDSISYNLVFAAEKVLGVPAGAILELFGEFFYEFCVESGYAAILKSLSATPIGFLESLDALHDHLGSTYCGMRAPSFRCTKSEETGSGEARFYLHYYSHRAALAPVVVGVVRAVCWDLFKSKAELKVVTDRPLEQGEVCFLVECSSEEKQEGEKEKAGHEIAHKLSHQPRISPATFAHLFPFHIIFNRQLDVVGVGEAIARLLPELAFNAVDSDKDPGSCLDKKFEILRPKLPFTFPSILGHINTVYVLGEINASADRSPLRLKGQMMHLPADDLIAYIASPSAVNLQQLFAQNLRLTDIPVHDSTRNLLTMAEHFSEEFELSHELEVLTNELQLRYRDVEIEKQKTERLVFASFPPAIVEEVKKGRKIPAKHYDRVTIMFTGINGFQKFCVENEPITIVKLLNDCYTEFDNVLDPEGLQKVYKVETIADHYMCVSGCPGEIPDHAGAMVELASRLMSASERVFYANGNKLEITIGIHTGEIVAGIIGCAMPRFCLFGDTVNTTSRTEAFGKRKFINLTQYTYDELEHENWKHPNIQLTFFESVAMKGKPKPMPLWLAEIVDEVLVSECSELQSKTEMFLDGIQNISVEDIAIEIVGSGHQNGYCNSIDETTASVTLDESIRALLDLRTDDNDLTDRCGSSGELTPCETLDRSENSFPDQRIVKLAKLTVNGHRKPQKKRRIMSRKKNQEDAPLAKFNKHYDIKIDVTYRSYFCTIM